MATIREIAKKAGVSPATVSNVLNGKAGKVSQENLQRVIEIANEMGYRQTRQVNNKVNKVNSRLIAGIVLNHDKYNFLEDPFYSQFFGEVIHVIQEYDYYLMLLSVVSFEQAIDILQYWTVDGAILVGAPDTIVHKLTEKINIPIAFIDSYSKKSGINKIGIDDFGGGQLAARHLLDLGHKQIAIISYWFSYDEEGVINERISGFEHEMSGRDIRFLKKNLFLVADEKDNAFYRAADDIIERMDEVSAVFCTSDRLAVHLIEYLRGKGIRVPEDLSVIGFDDSMICAHLSPGLTTIKQDIVKKAQISAQILLKQIGREGVSSESAVLPVTIVQRETTRKNSRD